MSFVQDAHKRRCAGTHLCRDDMDVIERRRQFNSIENLAIRNRHSREDGNPVLLSSYWRMPVSSRYLISFLRFKIGFALFGNLLFFEEK